MAGLYILIIISMILGFHVANAQVVAPDDLVSYERESNFIKEFQVPVDEKGIEGITTDTTGNVWFFYSTNTTSKIFNFNPTRNMLNQYQIDGMTVADNAVINLAAGQIAFDNKRNAVWFTDARTNSAGKLDITSGKIELVEIPTANAGPMGIILSPDKTSVWFTEITGDKLTKIDAQTMELTEYSIEEDNGPALLTFDDDAILWVTLSFSNSVLRVDPQALSSNPSAAVTELKLSGGDTFSPFGVAVSDGKVYVSDHGSSRIVVADTGFVNYVSYWTSPSIAFPTTLPSQVVGDKQGNIYFPQHGGNRISVIDGTGVMTEYEIPTGPLSTAVFIAAPDDGKVWFTEWASNKIAYLDIAMQVPFTLNVEKTAVTLDRSRPQSIAVSLNSWYAATSPLSISEVEIGLAGMTESGLRGLTYEAQPPRVNLQQARSAESEIQIRAQENARPGNYVAMVRAFAPEKDGLVISKLYPVELALDVPEPTYSQDSNQQTQLDNIVQNALRIGAPVGVAGLIAFAVYRWKKARRSERKR